MKSVTNIIYFLADMCIFQNVLIILYLQTNFGQRKSKVCFYTLNIVSYTINYKTTQRLHPILRSRIR